jgi:ferredoxin
VSVRVEIQASTCIGSSNCAEEAPDVFEVGDDSVARLIPGVQPSVEVALAGARACPVDAIHVHEPTGRRLHP